MENSTQIGSQAGELCQDLNDRRMPTKYKDYYYRNRRMDDSWILDYLELWQEELGNFKGQTRHWVVFTKIMC